MTRKTGSFGKRAAVAVAAVAALGLGGLTAFAFNQQTLDTNPALWALLEDSSMWKTYARQNPNESVRVKNYWLAGGTKPVVATKFGQFLVEVNEDRAVVPPPTTTDPPPTTTTPPPPPPPPTGFPDATNTGVPAGTVLTAYTGPSQITTAGTVIDSKTIGCITVEAANVTIRRSKITCGAFYGLRVANTNASASLLVEDTELSCNGANGHGFGERNITLRRVNVHHCENGLTVQDDVSVYDSYIHDLTMANDAHADGMQFEEAANNVNIVHNTIFGMGSNGQFGTSSLIADLRGHSNWLIERNLFGGGAFTVYCVEGKGTNWIIRNNAFTTRFSSKVGYFGHSTDCSDETQSGNYIYETGQPITLG